MACSCRVLKITLKRAKRVFKNKTCSANKGCVPKTDKCSKPITLKTTIKPLPHKSGSNHIFDSSGIEVEAAPNKDVKVPFKVTLRENPLDMYFLMDFSQSMKNDIDNLVEISTEMGTLFTEEPGTEQRLTSDYRVGFGSFVEKCVPPFSKHPDYYDNKDFMPYSFRY